MADIDPSSFITSKVLETVRELLVSAAAVEGWKVLDNAMQLDTANGHFKFTLEMRHVGADTAFVPTPAPAPAPAPRYRHRVTDRSNDPAAVQADVMRHVAPTPSAEVVLKNLHELDRHGFKSMGDFTLDTKGKNKLPGTIPKIGGVHGVAVNGQPVFFGATDDVHRRLTGNYRSGARGTHQRHMQLIQRFVREGHKVEAFFSHMPTYDALAAKAFALNMNATFDTAQRQNSHGWYRQNSY